VLKQRLIARGEKNFKLRLQIYSREQSQMGICDFIIKNNNLENTVKKIEAIVYHDLNNKPLNPTKSLNTVNDKIIDKYVLKLEKGKKIKPITVTLYNNEIYIIDGAHRYLASKKCGKNCAKIFVDNVKSNVNFKTDQSTKQAWEKLYNSFCSNLRK
jgi:uncharacterized protein (DUF1015 family)